MADDVAKALAEAGTQGATQFGPFGRLALDPRKLSDVAAALFGVAKAPFAAAQDIQQNYRPGAENEIVNQDIGRQAFDAGSIAMAGAPMVEKGAVGSMGGKPPSNVVRAYHGTTADLSDGIKPMARDNLDATAPPHISLAPTGERANAFAQNGVGGYPSGSAVHMRDLDTSGFKEVDWPTFKTEYKGGPKTDLGVTRRGPDTFERWDPYTWKALLEQLQKEGHPGAVVRNMADASGTGPQYVTLDASRLAPPTRVENPIKAYHGSPHDFDKFDAAHIGKGEGAQAYGHGLYFAEEEGVARDYRDKLGGAQLEGSTGNVNVDAMLRKSYGGDWDALKRSGYVSPEIIAYIEARGRSSKRNVPKASMYEVALHATPQQFLDWDKPLSQQSEGVGKGIRGILGDDRPLPPEPTLYERTQADLTGQKAIERLSRRYSPYRVGEVLREAGIPGIRYKDQLSRDPLITDSMVYKGNDGLWGFDDKLTVQRGLTGNRYPNKAEAMAALTAEMKPAAPTSNYVVFPGNEHIIEILKKYGIAGLLAAGAAMPDQGENH